MMALPSLNRNLTFNQNALCGIILFFSVGVYLAVLGLGAGGGKPSSQRVSDITNASLYAVFAVGGFFTGSMVNKLGPRWTMVCGTFGYPFYVAGLFYYDKTGGEAFPIIGGVILGVCAPMLWASAGFIQWAYSTEAEKGTYITIQFFINVLGSIVGSLVAFIIILKGAVGAQGSPTGVYVTFLILMFVGLLIALFGLVKPAQVRRADGTPIAVFHALTYKEEFRGIGRVLRDWRVIAMLPVSFSSEFHVSIMPILNAHYFSLRTRALNGVLFYVVMLPTAPLVSYLLDKLPFGRTKRGLIAVAFASFVVAGGWIALISWVCVSKTFANPPPLGIDWTDANFAGPFVLYLWNGVSFTCFQLCSMWIFGTFSNDPRTLAVYGGLWKGLSAAGLCVAFGLSAGGVTHRDQVIVYMCLQIASLIIMFVIIGRYSNETNYGQEANVVVPHYAEEKYHVHTVAPEEMDSVDVATDGKTDGKILEAGVTE